MALRFRAYAHRAFDTTRRPARALIAALLLALPVAVRADESAPTRTFPLKPDAEQAAIARVMADRMPREHLSHHLVDNTISRRTWNNYIDGLDPARMFFLESDIERFRASEYTLDDQLREGDLSFAFDVYELYRTRVIDRVAMVSNILDKGFDWTIDEDFRWQRKDEPWARDGDEWNDLWRKRVKNQVLQRMLTVELRSADLAETGTNTNDTVAVSITTNTSTVAAATNAANVTTDATAAVTNTLAAAAGTNSTENARPPSPPQTPEEYVLRQYQQFAVRLEDNDAATVFQSYMNAFATAYDPHCSYMSPASRQNFDIHMKLSLVGIGAVLQSEDGVLKIAEILAGGPAERDTRPIKLQTGDKIVAVAQGDAPFVDILHWPLYKAVGLIRGEKGTKVVLRVIDADDPTESTIKIVDLVRDEIQLAERAAKNKIHELPSPDAPDTKLKLGVITLPAFYADMQAMQEDDKNYRSCSRDVKEILDTMRTNGVDGVLLDLRNNGGGALREVVLMTGHFIRVGPVVLVRRGPHIQILPDLDPNVAYAGPLIVLVNRMSASASEILAGALQDYGRAIIVGDSKTFGKGSVQGVKALSETKNYGSIKVTNALYYRVSGSSTQLKGVSSDIVIPSANESLEIGEDFRPNALEWSMVRAAPYQPVADPYELIRALTERSVERRAASERFSTYTNQLARITAMNESETVALNLEKRREDALARKHLSELQKKLAKEEDGDNATADIVLDEALHILADMVALTHPPQRNADNHAAPPAALPAAHE